uniref:Putative secreted protein n=1 Tax=Anopheles darlingi TaxID=43151 RepID=A0A2M4D3R9_ANODA
MSMMTGTILVAARAVAATIVAATVAAAPVAMEIASNSRIWFWEWLVIAPRRLLRLQRLRLPCAVAPDLEVAQWHQQPQQLLITDSSL